MDPNAEIRLQKRNVEVFDSNGTVIAGTHYDQLRPVRSVESTLRVLAV